jgi:hypothetical protein
VCFCPFSYLTVFEFFGVRFFASFIIKLWLYPVGSRICLNI